MFPQHSGFPALRAAARRSHNDQFTFIIQVAFRRQTGDQKHPSVELTTVYFEQLPSPVWATVPIFQKGLWPGIRTFLRNFRSYQGALETRSRSSNGAVETMTDLLRANIHEEASHRHSPRRLLIKVAAGGVAIAAFQAYVGRRPRQ